MSKMWSICKRELLSYFISPIAYFVLTGFLLVGGYFFLNYLGYFNYILAQYTKMPYYSGAAMPNLNQWVIEGFYRTILLLMVFVVPFLTMRLLAEDRKRGTFELLITSPISITDIVLGKFFGVSAVIVLMILTVWAFPVLTIFFSDPEVPPIMSGLLGVILCSLSFASIGMAASAFTENQVIAGILGVVALLLLYVINLPAESIGGTVGDVLQYLSPVSQVDDMIKGVISIKSICYFVSLTLFGLFLTQRAVEAQRWR